MNPMLFQAGLTIFGNLMGSSGRSAANAQAEAQGIIAAASADAQNIVQAGNNQLSAAGAALGNFQRSVNNQEKQNNYAKSRSVLMTSMLRVMDQAAQGRFDQRIQAAEQMGAIAAGLGATGAGGSSAEMLRMTTELRGDRIQELAGRQSGQRTFDQLNQVLGLDDSRWTLVDLGQNLANQQFGQAFAPLRVSKVADDSLFGRAFGGDFKGLAKLLTDGFANGGSQSTGPQDIWPTEMGDVGPQFYTPDPEVFIP